MTEGVDVIDPLGLATSWQYWKRQAMLYQYQHWKEVAEVVFKGEDEHGNELAVKCKALLDEAQAELDAYAATLGEQR